jgi:hypothetical protein
MEILKIHASKLAKHGDIDYEAVVKLAEVRGHTRTCVQRRAELGAARSVQAGRPRGSPCRGSP